MSLKKTSTIFWLIVSTLLFAIGFFGGSIYQHNEFEDDRKINNEQIAKSDSISIYYLTTTDWNALKNIEVNSITDVCIQCSTKVFAAFNQLDERRKSKGNLVVARRN